MAVAVTKTIMVIIIIYSMYNNVYHNYKDTGHMSDVRDDYECFICVRQFTSTRLPVSNYACARENGK